MYRVDILTESEGAIDDALIEVESALSSPGSRNKFGRCFTNNGMRETGPEGLALD